MRVIPDYKPIKINKIDNSYSPYGKYNIVLINGDIIQNWIGDLREDKLSIYNGKMLFNQLGIIKADIPYEIVNEDYLEIDLDYVRVCE